MPNKPQEELTPAQKVRQSKMWPKCTKDCNRWELFEAAKERGEKPVRLTSCFQSYEGYFKLYGVMESGKEFCATFRAGWGEVGVIGPWKVSSIVYHLESLSIEGGEPEAALLRHKFMWEATNDGNN